MEAGFMEGFYDSYYEYFLLGAGYFFYISARITLINEKTKIIGYE